MTDLLTSIRAEVARQREKGSQGEAIVAFLSDQTYQDEPLLHAIVCCDFVSRQRLVSKIDALCVNGKEAELALVEGLCELWENANSAFEQMRISPLLADWLRRQEEAK